MTPRAGRTFQAGRSWPIMLLMAALTAAGAALPGCGRADDAAAAKRVLILGVDGVDPDVLGELMTSGRAPNLARLAASGSFKPLTTSMPPQSPVAWSNFIAGANPGTHQIYDFMHRDPNPAGTDEAITPYLSTSRTIPPARNWSLNFERWQLPLSFPQTELLRQGDAYWNHLIKHGIDTTVYRIPSAYPAPAVDGPGCWHCVSGMGTPDVQGTYGEFTCFGPWPRRYVGGGWFLRVELNDHRGTAVLEGPPNFLRRPDRQGRVPNMVQQLQIVRDPEAPVVKITVGDRVLLLNEGEWSDWVEIEFDTGIPAGTVLATLQYPTSIPAMVRMLVKQVHPTFELYVSPQNIDPLRPAMPSSQPESFSQKLAERTGRHYTTGIPEDAQALRHGALSEDQFLAQVRLMLEERLRQYRHALDNFERGCLFFYFGHTDQLAHMFWRDRDPEHPGRRPEQGDRYARVIEEAYEEVDALVGETLAQLRDDDTIIIMSDHGFTTFRWGFNLNRWLLQRGYLAVTAADPERALTLSDVDWSRTRAYALGLNSLYVNLRGREKFGIVAPGAERAALLRELVDELEAVRDAHGRQVIWRAYVVDETCPGADPEIAPDLLIGYNRGFRASWDTTLGGIPPTLLEDNLDRWSGTHLIAHDLVPGILISNRRVTVDDPALTDMAPTILSLFGIATPATMTGRPVLELE